MAKRNNGKKTLSFFSKKSRPTKRSAFMISPIPNPSVANSNGNNNGNLAEESATGVVSPATKGAKKKAGSRLWMRFDRSGQSETLECDKSVIIRRASIPARDLRILGPVFSRSSSILARERALVVNLEFIKAIVTADEVLVLDPLAHEVLPFVDQLRQQIPLKSHVNPDGGEGESELPFEFQVLEVALEVVCMHLDSSVGELEKDAYPVLDELAKNVSTKKLEQVRSLKSNLTRLLARVQKVRDEIEHLLDDNEDMAHLYLSRRQIQNQQVEALMASVSSNGIVPAPPNLARLGSKGLRGTSIAASIYSDDNDVEDLEMLLEAYFMQLDGTRNKILSVREYIDDTEDYVNIQLDNQRNELIQLQLTLSIVCFAIAIDTLIVGIFAMNLPCHLYNVNGIFWSFVAETSSACFLILLLVLGYARWKKLLGP